MEHAIGFALARGGGHGFEVMLRKLRSLALRAALRVMGQTIRDYRTGRALGRALLVPWRGEIYVIGLRADVVPVFVPERELVYWRQRIGFTVHPPPDFDDLRNADCSADAPGRRSCGADGAALGADGGGAAGGARGAEGGF